MKMAQIDHDIRTFVQPTPLEEYRNEVSEHLQYIEHGAGMITRRVGMLSRAPGFRAMAQDEMDTAEAVLERALANVRAAKAVYEQKPRERSDAMHAL